MVAKSEHEVGPRLRAAREARGITLRRLSKSVGISASALSQIETSRSRPSVSTLYRLVSELGLSLDELLGSDSGWSASSTARPARTFTFSAARGMAKQDAGDRRTLVMDSGVVWERLTPMHEPDVDFLDVTYEIGGASSTDEKFVRHSGREYGVVLEGNLRVTVGFESVDLAPGDSIVFDSSVPHRLENIGETKVRAIWVSLGRYESDPRSDGLLDQPGAGPR